MIPPSVMTSATGLSKLEVVERPTGRLELRVFVKRGDDFELVGFLDLYPAELTMLSRELSAGKMTIHVPTSPDPED